MFRMKEGSQPKCVKLEVQGVPAYGIVDSGADITIIGGTLFQKVASVARLKKRDLKKPDKPPRNYDQRPFSLDGRMDLDLTFDGQTMKTPIYVKIDSHEQLLLSEGVCRQLGIITYHPAVEAWRGRKQPQPTIQKKVVPSLPTLESDIEQSKEGEERHSHTKDLGPSCPIPEPSIWKECSCQSASEQAAQR